MPGTDNEAVVKDDPKAEHGEIASMHYKKNPSKMKSWTRVRAIELCRHWCRGVWHYMMRSAQHDKVYMTLNVSCPRDLEHIPSKPRCTLGHREVSFFKNILMNASISVIHHWISDTCSSKAWKTKLTMHNGTATVQYGTVNISHKHTSRGLEYVDFFVADTSGPVVIGLY